MRALVWAGIFGVSCVSWWAIIQAGIDIASAF